MGEQYRAYYAIIPAKVRYDKDISPNAKLLYGEITALTNEKGYCWATNEYFAKLYGVSKQSISYWIKSLKDKNYITTEIIYKEGTKEILYRYIKILEYPIKENLNTPIKENFKENNTYINNTKNNKYYNNNVPNWLNKDLDVSQLTTDEIKEMQALFDTILIN